MKSVEVILVLIAALWAFISALIEGYKAVNEKRDIIVNGVIGGTELTLEHRQLMFHNDWIPFKFGLGFISLIFTFIILVLPLLVDISDRNIILWIMCFSVSIVPLLSTIGWWFFGLSDYHFILKVLRKTKCNG